MGPRQTLNRLGWVTLRLSIFVMMALAVVGCVDPSSVARPEAELTKPGERSSMTASVKREGGKVWIEGVQPTGDGNGHVRGLEVLLAYAGTPVAYERLMGLSGMAFITQADTGHRWEGVLDVGWWPLDEWGLSMRLDFLGRAVGRDLKKVTAPTSSPPKPAETYRAHFGPLVKKSIDEGRPLLTPTDFGFVIFGYDDESEQPPVLGRCARETTTEMYRMESWPWALFILGEPTTPMDADAADLAALQYAVDLAYDRAGPDDPRWRGRRLTGQKAFAAWSAVLRNPEEPVQDRHHANMRGNLHWNRTTAVAYLREVASRRDEQAAEALREAAASYESVLTQLGQLNCTGLADDLEARRTLADRIHRIAATELEAVGHIQTALAAADVAPVVLPVHTRGVPAAASQDRVRREGGKVWIDGVPTLSWKKDGQCTYAGALAAALEVTEHPYSYSEIMGFSGLAFRARWYQNDTGTAWCPSSPVGEFPEPMAATEQATGWRFRGVVLLGEKEPHMEQFAPDIVAAIDSGRPVLAYEPRLNMAVIYGYEDGGETVLLRDYFTGETPLELPTAKLGAMLVFLARHSDPLPRREALVTALQGAVRNWHRGRAGNNDGSWYCYGEEALSAWERDLGTVTTLSDEQKGNLCFVSWWNFVSLHDARRNAVSFLRNAAPLLDGDAARALVRAADLYHEEAELLGSALANKDAFLGSVEGWTAQLQQRERQILAQAREKEAAAIAEIGKALALLE